MLGPELMWALSSRIQELASALEDQQAEMYETVARATAEQERTRALCARGPRERPVGRGPAGPGRREGGRGKEWRPGSGSL